MDRRAYERAAEHFEDASRVLTQMGCSADLRELTKLWSEFLTASHRVYSKLAAGAHGPSQGWFGKLKGLRKSDPLLLYVHQARHADEHRIDPISRIGGGGLAIRAAPGEVGMTIRNLVYDHGRLTFEADRPVEVNFRPNKVQLMRVLNERAWYDPPDRHLGQPFPDANPINVAEAVISHLKSVLAEAKGYVAR